jgi:hypothetical protein
MPQRKLVSTLLLAGLSIALTVLIHLGLSHGNAMAQDPCFYQKSDGTTVDLGHLCGQRSGGRSRPNSTPQNPTAPSMVQSGNSNPAMQITAPNDPGVLYISDSDSNNAGVKAAQESELRGGR